jgi:hypothetical protein
MSDFVNFTSLPPDQEAGFIVFEQRMEAAQKNSWTVAIVAAIAVFVVAIGIYLGVAPDETDISKDMNMSNLTRTQAPAGATTPAAAPAPAPAPEAGSAAPAPAPAPSN